MTATATIQNQAGASFNFLNDASLEQESGYGGTRIFNNAGVLARTSGTGTSGLGAPVTNTGTIRVNTGALDLAGGLTNFSGATLTGGSYELTGVLKFPGANIGTNAAAIVLDGPSSAIVNTSGADALAGFAGNLAAGSFTIRNGRNFTTPDQFSNSGNITVGAGSTFGGGAAYNQTAGSTAVNGTISFIDIDIISGILWGNGTITGNLGSGGTVAPGGSPGILTVTGDYTQRASGTLDIEINNYGAGAGFDQLIVTGWARMGGTLKISVATNFEMEPGARFQVLRFSNGVGPFASVSGNQAPGFIRLRQDFVWNADLTPTAIRMQFPSPSPISPSGPVSSLTPTFRWSAVSGASFYRIMVGTPASGLPADPVLDTWPGLVVTATTSETSYTPPGPLSAGATYWWQVKAMSPSGYEQSAWSAPAPSFTTPLAAPSPVNPPNNSMVSSKPLFGWSELTGAGSYRVMVATSQSGLPADPSADTGTGLVINAVVTTNSFAPGSGVLSPGQTYWWQVKGID
ncbi:MAG: hypothetical protein HYU43_06240, partial [Armatimonadetes bacterium]|nr:hypothetical protein [Armatimonadota bacterium]